MLWTTWTNVIIFKKDSIVVIVNIYLVYDGVIMLSPSNE